MRGPEYCQCRVELCLTYLSTIFLQGTEDHNIDSYLGFYISLSNPAHCCSVHAGTESILNHHSETVLVHRSMQDYVRELLELQPVLCVTAFGHGVVGHLLTTILLAVQAQLHLTSPLTIETTCPP